MFYDIIQKIKNVFSPKKENIIKFRYSDLPFLSENSFRYEYITESDYLIRLENGWIIELFNEENMFLIYQAKELSYEQIHKIKCGEIITLDFNEEFEGVSVENDEYGNKVYTYNSVLYNSKSIQYNTGMKEAYLIHQINKSMIEYM